MSYAAEISLFENRARTRIGELAGALSPDADGQPLALLLALSDCLELLRDNRLPADRQLRLVHLLSERAQLGTLEYVDYGRPLLPVLATAAPAPPPAAGADPVFTITPTRDEGGLKAGVPFTGTSQQFWVKSLVEYQVPAFTGFALDGQGSLALERGAAFLGHAGRTFTWSLAHAENLAPGSLRLRELATGQVLASGLANTGSLTLALDDLSVPEGEARRWRLSATTTQGGSLAADVTLTGYARAYYGPLAAEAYASDDVRALAGTFLVTGPGQLTLITGKDSPRFGCWLPEGRQLTAASDLDALGADLLDQYEPQLFFVEDADGQPRPGTLYTMTQAVPYSSPHRHQLRFV